MSRTARLWKGVGPLTLGGILLSGGIAALATESDSLSKQLANLGRQAASQGRQVEVHGVQLHATRFDLGKVEYLIEDRKSVV